jgi:ubiquinone/menaquinone biosynthesis C-methylase UbiE
MESGRIQKEVYEATLADGSIYGKLGIRDLKRFKTTERYILSDAKSLLDVGCFCGEWLSFLLNRRENVEKHLGIDVAENKIEEAGQLYPDLNLKVAFAEDLDVPDASFDVVTCLEVLEHIPDWNSVFESLFRFAAKQVVVTVPYEENIMNTVCIHCGNVTPLYGHLHRYSEESFPEIPGWSRSFKKMVAYNPSRTLIRRFYRFLKPTYSWLLVNYRRIS